METMKAELTEVSETRKHLSFEIPHDVVEAEIARVALSYSKSARVPGFRPGKVPAHVIRQRYKDQILYDVAHDLIPKVVGDALRDRKLDPVATPDIRDVVLDEGKPLTFIADFEVTPPIDPGVYTGISLRKPPAVLEVGAVDQAIERLRERAAKYLPVEDRAAAKGDSLLLDLTRTVHPRTIQLAGESAPPADAKANEPEVLQNVSIELGAPANPPGFDDNLAGLSSSDQKSFTVTYPADYPVAELASVTVDYAVTVKGIRLKDLPAADDDFAKEVSDLETMAALRDRVKDDLQHQAEHESDHKVRHDLLQDLAGRIKGAVPDALVDHEVERRLEELVRRMMEQGIDPTKAQIDWQQFRAEQRTMAESTVKSTLVLDEVARREHIVATDEDVDTEVNRYAERSGRTGVSVRARLEKEGGLARIREGILREKTMAWLIEKATIVG